MTENKNEPWCFYLEDDDCAWEGGETRESAVAAAVEYEMPSWLDHFESEGRVECTMTFEVGRCRLVPTSKFYPEFSAVLDEMAELGLDVGEYAPPEDHGRWPPPVAAGHQAELKNALRAALDGWFEAHPEYKADWWTIADAEDVTVEARSDGTWTEITVSEAPSKPPVHPATGLAP